MSTVQGIRDVLVKNVDWVAMAVKTLVSSQTFQNDKEWLACAGDVTLFVELSIDGLRILVRPTVIEDVIND